MAYNRFRYYDPEDGRYISADPIGLFSGEKNLYSYINDPNDELDIYGLAKSYHANSKKSKKKNHVYEIYNNKTKKTYKYGISSGKKTLGDDPKSYRANSQKSKIAKQEGIDVDDISTKLLDDDISRVDALDVEQAKVDDFYSNNDRPPKYNKRPKPTALR